MQAAAPARRHARLLALRAIMDGREVPVVVLRGAAAVAHYADLPAAEGAVLVVTAADAVLLEAEGGEGAERLRHERVSPERLWDRVAALIGQRQPVGHDDEAPPLAGPLVALGDLIARQMRRT